jgi:hypothetical protein
VRAVGGIIERGDVFFFYRPRVDTDEVDDLGDVQRFFLVLKPDGTHRFRRVVVGRKRLPDALRHEREWAFVAEVADDPEELQDELTGQVYETKSRGVREQGAARPVGAGRYALVDHDGHTHLAYELERPHQPGPAQDTFGIRPEASYIIAVRDPRADAPPGTGLRPEQRAQYPPELLERFGGRRFAPVDVPELLDHEGAELVLIGAGEEVDPDLGIDLGAAAEHAAQADIFRQLRIRPEELPVDPLERGELR